MQIQRKYETEYDRAVEIELGNRFVYASDDPIRVENMPYLSTYDFKMYKKDLFYGWLEVKRKSGDFSHTEIIPITKWRFAQHSDFPCFFLVERWDKAMLFDITDIVRKNGGQEIEITRRPDQPEGSRKVVRFPIIYGKVIYYL